MQRCSLAIFLLQDAFWPIRQMMQIISGRDLKKKRIQSVIPNKVNRKQPYPFNKKHYRGRNVIERMFGRLKDFRRIATRYDKNAENVMAFLLCFISNDFS